MGLAESIAIRIIEVKTLYQEGLELIEVQSTLTLIPRRSTIRCCMSLIPA